ncbi:hypothetical protein IDSA_05540 [Pseudidiomarina salinarum]|uniref:CD-NTase-associated protein 12/Pycsar effector protein TIR domain-containing protein n=1 Tax=Pseudidiomarina salinarum TaxID=435908 RepID=A0A094LB56_9GAMM|nr:hypothetical protein [Pseudidiomarina salinarum]KFZ32128.1 hypothetical protein IDSA_05540 [Pseudidiomarina salinarum]RUO70086.1 hypothetical protein CWI79_01055 [Pseudidiomarina salinarum]
MKRVGFITDNIDIEEPISKILLNFDGREEIRVETINRLNPELPTINKIQSILEMCDVIVFYISKGSPNIYYEIGLAHGSKKNVIIIADSHRNIPFDFSFQKCIITEGNSFEYVAYEIFRAIDDSPKSNVPIHFSNIDSSFIFESYFNDYAPVLRYRDLYAFSGSKRNRLFEQWFLDLARNINQWKVIESDKPNVRDSFDFMLWNSADDPELQLLGNPIPVELKALNFLNANQWSRLAESIRKKGLRSLLLLTTAKNKRNAASFANRLREEYGVLIVALDRDDLIDIEKPKDLYLAIRQQLLNIMYRGG